MVCGGICAPFATLNMGCATGRHFVILTINLAAGQNGPLIPCERRLAKREIPEFQEVTSGTRFGK